MKNLIYTILFVSGIFNLNAQTVQATVKKASDNCVTIFALASIDVNDPPSNFVISLSVPDQTSTGGTNPNIVVSDIITEMQVDPGTPPPYISSGRYYLDLNFTPTVGSPAPLAWTGLVEYPLATVCFSGATPPPVDELVQINDLASFGANGFTTWYFEVQGGGDLTDYAAKFYDDGGVTSTASNGGDSQAETTQSVILPIILRSFTATKNDRSVDLNWITSSEINGSHFEIERSQDLNSWSNIGTVQAIGESSTAQEYSFLDDKLPLNTRQDHKTFYYRLNMVDNDGASEYSDTRTVRFDLDGEADFLVYPNPSINEVYVNLSSITPETGPATLMIININGQLVKRVTMATSDDIRIDVSDLTGGVYNFVIRQGEQTFSQKVIKVD